MNELKIFENEEFGAIREMTIDGEPWFAGNDVAFSLGYARARDAVMAHVESEDKLKRQITASGQRRDVTFINESGLYSLIMQSKLPTAKKFKRWVTSEVLPSIRKNGGYGDMKLIVSQCVQEVMAQIVPLLEQNNRPVKEELSAVIRGNALQRSSYT